MKKGLKKFLKWGCGTVAALFLVLVLLVALSIYGMTMDGRIAKDPERIAAEADFDLPDYVIVRQSDNMDRGSSAWSQYTWKLRLKEPLSDNDLEKLQRLVKKNSYWTYNAAENTYVYLEEGDVINGERSMSVSVHIYDDHVTVEMYYCWWDDEW